MAFARVADAPDAAGRLRALAHVSADIVRADLNFWRLSYGVRFQHAVVAGLGERVAAQAAALRATWELLLTELGVPDPPVEAALMFAAFDGVFQHYVLDPAGYPLDAVLTALIRRYLPPEAR